MRHRTVHFRSPPQLSPSGLFGPIFSSRTLPWLLDHSSTACLKPAPARRLRGADPHLLYSTGESDPSDPHSRRTSVQPFTPTTISGDYQQCRRLQGPNAPTGCHPLSATAVCAPRLRRLFRALAPPRESERSPSASTFCCDGKSSLIDPKSLPINGPASPGYRPRWAGLVSRAGHNGRHHNSNVSERPDAEAPSTSSQRHTRRGTLLRSLPYVSLLGCRGEHTAGELE